MTKKLVAMILTVGLLAGITGCSDNPLTGSIDEKKYKTEEAVTLPMGNVKTLNPIASTDEDTYFISKLVYDSLFVLDGEMVPQEFSCKGL